MSSQNTNMVLLQPAKQCFDKDCLIIFSSENTSVQSGVVCEINIGIPINVANNHVLQVFNHCYGKPWKVLVNCIYPNTITGELIIPIISDQLCFTNKGDILCHVKEISRFVSLLC